MKELAIPISEINRCHQQAEEAMLRELWFASAEKGADEMMTLNLIMFGIPCDLKFVD